MAANITPDQIARLRDAQRNVMAMRLSELEVCEYWGVIFTPRGITTLTKQDIKGFMSYAQNRRWREIHREDVAIDMEALRIALSRLIDHDSPLNERLNDLEPGRGPLAIAHLGKAKMSPILLVSSPRLYGVWNDYSERALTSMGLFPNFSTSDHLGEQYVKVNEVLCGLAKEYKISLWRLDIILEQIARLVR
jgi:hypothetical protein